PVRAPLPPPEPVESEFASGLGSGRAAIPAQPLSGVNPQGGYFQPRELAPLAPYTAGQPAAAAPPAASGPDHIGSPSSGWSGSPAPAMGGAPSAMGGAPPMTAPPMMPYSPPGAANTAPSPTPQPVPSGPATAATAPAGPPSGPPVIGATASSATTAAAAADQHDPHLALAVRTLENLIRGTDAARLRLPLGWAVAVIETAAIPRLVVASSAGDGAYIPPTVHLPVEARLAIHDRDLRGWDNGRYVGWQRPTAVIEGYFQAATQSLYDVRCLAVATCEAQPRRPAIGGRYTAVTEREVLNNRPGPAPTLDAAHKHRLAATDEGTSARLSDMVNSAAPEQRRQVQSGLAVAVTDAVLSAAAEPDGTGEAVATPADMGMWAKIRLGTATGDDWLAWREDVDARDFPEMYAPGDLDDAAPARVARLFYRHHYARARVAELIGCWHPQSFASLHDTAYLGIAAGYPAQVAAAISNPGKATK
ncbi:MAG TPA: hypothetical protein VMU34_01890, partial [Mycobacterium sp.]|nr:hypothetical protein [Mycobacterium sp.]